ncbi:MAG: DUF402 domain-containing protein, partial [Erysipelotrichaceae bacterium]|nr:DUF402 domain-containing protein [Erysipelotrichaceae bacterium]
MEIRDMRRTAWRRVKQKEQIILPCSYGNVQGKVSLLKIREVSEPFSAVFNGEQIVLAERNYSWLQLAMENDFAWFTVMFDDSDRFLQDYVDLTCGNLTDRDNPVFEDLYLDYVLCEGQVKEMDADELAAAFENGTLSETVYVKAQEHGKILYSVLQANAKEITSYFENLLKRLQE